MLIERQKISEHFFNNALCADDLFRGLSPESENFLLSIEQPQNFAKDETIFAGGQMPCCIYILREGEAEIFYQGDIYQVKKNQVLGLTEALADLPSEISVKASAPCRFECIRRDAFLEFLRNEPEICFRLLQKLGANIQKIYRFLR
jgi:CRP-like cAMP-binding protein